MRSLAARFTIYYWLLTVSPTLRKRKKREKDEKHPDSCKRQNDYISVKQQMLRKEKRF